MYIRYLCLLFLLFSTYLTAQQFSFTTGTDLFDYPELDNGKLVVYSNNYGIAYDHKLVKNTFIGFQYKFITVRGNYPYPKTSLNPDLHNFGNTQDFVFENRKFERGIYSPSRGINRVGLKTNLLNLCLYQKISFNKRLYCGLRIGTGIALSKENGLSLVVNDGTIKLSEEESRSVKGDIYVVFSELYFNKTFGIDFYYKISPELGLGVEISYNEQGDSDSANLPINLLLRYEL